MNSYILPKNIIYETWLRLEENDLASAAFFLWSFHEEQPKDWPEVKVFLLKQSSGHKELFMMANLLGIAEKEDLSASYHLVPGLSSLYQRIQQAKQDGEF
jgi:hypothetical protein